MIHNPLKFLIDRCLGTKAVPAAMGAALAKGEKLKCLDDLFPPTTPDVTWLTAVAAQGWVIITKDGAIRRNPMEKQALLAANTAAFFFGNASLAGPKVGAGLALAMPAMRRAILRFEVPILGRVNAAGELSVIHVAGEDLKAPKLIKVRRLGEKP